MGLRGMLAPLAMWRARTRTRNKNQPVARHCMPGVGLRRRPPTQPIPASGGKRPVNRNPPLARSGRHRVWHSGGGESYDGYGLSKRVAVTGNASYRRTETRSQRPWSFQRTGIRRRLGRRAIAVAFLALAASLVPAMPPTEYVGQHDEPPAAPGRQLHHRGKTGARGDVGRGSPRNGRRRVGI
jgi:hypothetical protein